MKKTTDSSSVSKPPEGGTDYYQASGEITGIDRTAPDISTVALANAAADGFINASEKDATTGLITAPTVTDAQDGSPTVQYAVIDATAICFMGTFTATLPAPTAVTSDGAYKVCVQATDTAGNSDIAESSIFTRDVVASDITVGTLDTSAGSITATVDATATGWYIKKTTNTCAAGDFTGSEVSYTFNTPILLTTDDNDKYLCFKSEDAAGNTDYQISAQITGITATPTITLATASDSGISDSDNITNDDTPTVVIAGYPDNDFVRVTASKSGAGDVIRGRSGDGEVTLGTLEDGVWTITATDGTLAALPLTVTIDTTNPGRIGSSFRLINAAADFYINAEEVTDTGYITTIPSAADATALTITYAINDYDSDDECKDLDSSHHRAQRFSASDFESREGDWIMCTTLTDAAGNFTKGETSNYFTVDRVPPTITLSTLAVTLETGTITATVSDGVRGDQDGNSYLYVLADSTAACTETAFADSAGESYTSGTELSITLAESDNGRYLCFRAEDEAGNERYQTSAAISGVTPPPSVDLKPESDTGAHDDDNITNDNTPTLTISGFGNTDTVTVTATKAGENNVTAELTGNGEVTLAALADGEWSITATNGTLTTSALQVTVDTASPVLTGTPAFIGVAADGYINDAEKAGMPVCSLPL